MRFLKYLIIIPVVIYAGAMGYLWYEVKSNADRAVESAAAFARITYEGIHISPLGDEVGVDAITIKPQMTGDSFRIGELRLSVPHIGYFLNATNRIEKGKMPENLGMQLNRVEVDLNSELFTMMEQMQQQQAAMGQPQADNFFGSLEALGCGGIDSFSLSDYRAMGIGEVTGDVSVGMRYDDITNITRIEVNANADGLYRTDLSAEMDTDSLEMASGNGTFSFRRATLTYRDTGYYELRNNYCAERTESDTAAYIERHAQRVADEIGATVPEQTLTAYRDFMRKGGTIVADMQPGGDVPLTTLSYYKPEEIVHMLGLKLKINNTPVKLAGFGWDGSTTASSSQQAAVVAPRPRTAPPPTRPEVTAAQPEPRRSTNAEYDDIELDEASNYLTRTVEVTLYDGKVRSGTLESVGESRLYLVMHLHGGELSYPVKLGDITRLRLKR